MGVVGLGLAHLGISLLEIAGLYYAGRRNAAWWISCFGVSHISILGSANLLLIECPDMTYV